MSRRQATIRAPRLKPEERSTFLARYERLVPVTYTVIAGPPEAPQTVTMLEDPESKKKGRRR